MSEAVEAIAEEEVETVEQKYNIRPLGSDDIFAICRIISAIGLKNLKGVLSADNVKDVLKLAKAGEEQDIEAVGAAVVLEIVDVLFASLPKCKNELQSFLADILGMTVEEVGKIPPADYLEIIVTIFKRKDFTDFFARALRLFK